MSEILLAGNYTSALSTLAGVGLAGILEDSGVRPVRFWWTDAVEPQLRLLCEMELDEIAAVVQLHAQSHLGEQSWVQARRTDGKAVFAARQKPPPIEQWSVHYAERESRWPETQWGSLDGRMLGALGEPAWWRHEKSTPDEGASRWEMKARNRGEEFVKHRLAPLAKVVSARSVTGIADGLSGACCVDELGEGGKTKSRTATGLTVPGRTDSVMAWCALWGISSLPVLRRAGGISVTAGMWPRGDTHPRLAVLPVFTAPVSLGRWRAIASSHAFDVVARSSLAYAEDSEDPSSDFATAESWLREQAVSAIVAFEVEKAGTTSAPERRLLTGRMRAL